MIIEILVLLFLIYVLWQMYVHKVEKRLIHNETGAPMPGPPPSFLGLSGFRLFLKGSFNGLVKECKPYGPVCRVFVGPFVWVIVADHSTYQILFTKSKTFHRGMFNDVVDKIAPGALFVTEGQMWRRHRLALGPFFSDKEMSKTANTFAAITRDAFNEIPEGETFSVQYFTSQITSKILMKSLFNYHYEGSAEGEKLHKDALNMMRTGPGNITFYFLLFPFLSKLSYFKNLISKFHAPFFKIIDTIKENSTGETLWDKLEFTSGDKFTWEEFQYESLGLLLAGFETTSTALSWVLWTMEKFPHVKEKLKKEIHEVLGGRFPTVDDIESLTYLDKFILESFRYNGPILIMNRVAVQNDTLNGFRIPTGTQVFTSLHEVVKNEFENPNEFNPDRFNSENYAALSKLALTGFGTGPHVCIGKHLALLELKLITAYLIQTDKIKVNLDTATVDPRKPVYAPLKLTAVKLAKSEKEM